MKALVLRETGVAPMVETIAHAIPGDREVLVEIAATGLCHTDLHFMKGHLPVPLPAVLGHETAGRVLAVGAGVSAVRPGDHVIGCLSAFCGSCEYCLSGHPSICDGALSLTRPDGDPPRLHAGDEPVAQFMNLSGFAERALVHENALVKIDTAMPLDRAALIGCAVITGFGAVTHTANVKPGSSVAIIGCGAVGLSLIQGARLAGALDIIAIDLLANRRETAMRFGATATLDGHDADIVDRVRQLTLGKGVHTAFDAVGQPRLAEQAFLMTRKGGTTVLVGLMASDAKVELPFLHFVAERRVMGCDMGSNRFRTDMPRLVRLYLDGRLNLDDMITARLPLAKINDGFAMMERGEGIRTIVDFAL